MDLLMNNDKLYRLIYREKKDGLMENKTFWQYYMTFKKDNEYDMLCGNFKMQNDKLCWYVYEEVFTADGTIGDYMRVVSEGGNAHTSTVRRMFNENEAIVVETKNSTYRFVSDDKYPNIERWKKYTNFYEVPADYIKGYTDIKNKE